MRFHSLNYLDRREREGRARRWYHLVSVGFWAHDTPRLLWRCWALGHRPVVFGTDPIPGVLPSRHNPAYRWVACARCGERGQPQGSLHPATFAIGQRYRGPWRDRVARDERDERAQRDLVAELKKLPEDAPYYAPGPIARTATGTLGGQLVIGGGYSGPSFELKVGNAGSEHTLAARLSLGWLGALYLHTERHGQWLQQWLNPTGYESKVISVGVHRWRVRWRWWCSRDVSYGRRRPAGAPSWWRDGDLRLVPPVLDWLLGKRKVTYFEPPLESFEVITGVGAGIFRCVQLHDGNYLVKLKLQQVTVGRARGRRTVTWEVDWSAQGRGIPTEAPGRGRIFGSSVTVSNRAVTGGTWAAEAAAAIALDITQSRTREGWEPAGHVPVLSTTGAPR